MDLHGDNVIGIVGGMGPQAGLALFNSILCHTKAVIDQQHLSVMLMSLPRYLVDRTDFLEGRSTINPAFNIVELIQRLEVAGAKVIGIACNTAHAPRIYNVIVEQLFRSNSQVKLVHMPQATCNYIRRSYPEIRRIGLLTTNGTYKSGVYRDLLLKCGYEVVLPDSWFQHNVIHRMIYDPVSGIKANPDRITKEAEALGHTALDFFRKRQADAIIIGCTELSLMRIGWLTKDISIIDATEALALALIREAINYQKNML